MDTAEGGAAEGAGAEDGRAAAVDRRSFLQLAGGGAAATLALGAAGALLPARPAAAIGIDQHPAGLHQNRRAAAFRVRVRAAHMARRRPLVHHETNGDERRLPGFIGNYSKGLPHDARGEVDAAAYRSLLRALRFARPGDFERIQLGGELKLVAPQTGLAFELEGPDSHHVTCVAPPSFSSAEQAAEMAELYWMALLRDVHFEDYEIDRRAAAACRDLTDRFSAFQGPTRAGAVTPSTLFRGSTAGDRIGPYISQFLWLPVPYGPQRIEQRNQTTLPGGDWLTDSASWLAAQNGSSFAGRDLLDPSPRYLRNLRDLARWVQVDALYQAYLNACLILLGMGAPVDEANPMRDSATQVGFGEWGPPHVLSLLTEVATRALKAVWYQKWFVHRRLRPEEFGGRVHHHAMGAARYPIHDELWGSLALEEIFDRTGSYLLPMAYPEGCPAHPSYGAGHATVAGACTTILKAWFDESFVIPDTVVASADGTALLRYAGPDLTLGNELDKLAANVSIGRNGAGVHWRSDYSASVRLGEEIALGILREQAITYNERVRLSLQTFDGARVSV